MLFFSFFFLWETRECDTHFHTGHQLHAVAQTDIRPDVPGTAQQLHGFFKKIFLQKNIFSLEDPLHPEQAAHNHQGAQGVARKRIQRREIFPLQHANIFCGNVAIF